jgi:hypothetical protein
MRGGCVGSDNFVLQTKFQYRLNTYTEARLAQLVKALCYKPEGRGLDSR